MITPETRNVHTVVAVVTLIAVTGVAGARQTTNGRPGELYGVVAKIDEKHWINPVHERKDLTPVQKTEIMLSWLAGEKNDPSPTTTGGSGGDITTGYIQAQVIRCLMEYGDLQAMDWVAANPGLKDEGVRDGIRLALAQLGDRRQVGRLIAILRHDNEPYYRAEAARALQILGATEAIPALQESLNDDFSVHASNCMKGDYIAYPVRDNARLALRALQMADALRSAGNRDDRFAGLLVADGAQRAHVQRNRGVLARLLSAANGEAIQKPAGSTTTKP